MLDVFYLFVILTLLSSMTCFVVEDLSEKSKKHTPVFAKKIPNILHFMSYTYPFVWFIDTEGKGVKTKKTKQDLADAHLNHLINYRSFTVLRVLQLILSVVGFFILTFLIKHSHSIIYFLFRTEVAPVVGADLTDMKYIIIMVLATLLLIPNFILKKRINNYSYKILRDVPLLQMFILLMLRSNKTTSETIYGLSQINTFYREIFHIAYLRYLRSSEECFSYLEDVFEDSDLIETIKALETLPSYSREKTIDMIENQMKDTVTSTSNKKRSKDITGLVFSQATIIFPFVAFILLCLVPIAMYGISIMGNSGMMLFG